MSSASYQHSISKPLEPLVISALRSLDQVARTANSDFFVVGATARDLILVNVHGLRPARATRDIDFGIAVESWQQFEVLKRRLIATGEFVANPKAQQRLTYTDQITGSWLPIDLIPFRGVTSPTGTIMWPPNGDIVMNVAGFEEALDSSVSIKLEPTLSVRVASVPGLALLKLIAWSDRGRVSNKD